MEEKNLKKTDIIFFSLIIIVFIVDGLILSSVIFEQPINLKFLGEGKIKDYSLPPWVKQSAGWWAEGKITDKEFYAALQYLFDNGYINQRD